MDKFEEITQKLNEHLDSVMQYMFKYKNSMLEERDRVTGVVEAMFSAHVPSLISIKTALDIMIDDFVRITKMKAELSSEDEELLSMRMKHLINLTNESQSEIENTGDLISKFLNGRKVDDEVSIHNYSIYVYIVSIYEKYLYDIARMNNNDLVKYTGFGGAITYYRDNYINVFKNWYASAIEINKIRNCLVHNNGIFVGRDESKDVKEKKMLIRKKHEIQFLLNNISEFIAIYRTHCL
ncbi:hypothetical protein ABE504_05835 [Paenibacillus oryzisoli]|uniref:hypothetical protein n=1 Tax=Paenibacillus oryzisoli TaxID=1850517 RepID=UPI003D29F8C9